MLPCEGVTCSPYGCLLVLAGISILSMPTIGDLLFPKGMFRSESWARKPPPTH
jgi:hypothetical protein